MRRVLRTGTPPDSQEFRQLVKARIEADFATLGGRVEQGLKPSLLNFATVANARSASTA